ncbi:hypothetical protein [Pseudoduganella sp. R-43]|uniref:hypothetical protein n=1 Tax=Pseudoduganella sp. R-43 TaxID=3404063 RepID=UPI003CFB354A
MKTGLPALLLLLATQAGAQGFVSMGRLFTIPDERAQLDTQRNQGTLPGAAAVPAPGGNAQAAGPVPVAPGMEASAHCQPGSAPGCPPAAAPGTAAAETPGGPGAGETAPPGLRLGGVIRRSNGPTMIIVNGEAQAAPPGGVMRGSVTLQADGRSVVLKPGQRYDPATGEVHEAAR